MTTQVDIIERLTTIAEGLSYTVSEEEVSESSVSDTNLPAMLISNIETKYDKQQQNLGVVETYRIGFIFMFERPSNGKVLSLLAIKKQAFIVACQQDQTLQTMIQRNSFAPVQSNESNAVKQHSPKGSKAVSFVLSITIKLVQDYQV